MEYEYLTPINLEFVLPIVELKQRLDDNDRWERSNTNKRSKAERLEVARFKLKSAVNDIKAYKAKVKADGKQSSAMSRHGYQLRINVNHLEREVERIKHSSPIINVTSQRRDVAKIREWMVVCEAHGIDPHVLFAEAKHYLKNERSGNAPFANLENDAGDNNFAVAGF